MFRGPVRGEPVSATTNASGVIHWPLRQLVERGRHEALCVGRVHEDKIEGRAEPGGLGAEVGGRAAVDAGVSEELEGFDIVADAAARGSFGFDEEAEGRRRGTSASKPSAPEPAKASITRTPSRPRRPFGVGEDVEDAFAGAVGRRARVRGHPACGLFAPSVCRRRCAWASI